MTFTEWIDEELKRKHMNHSDLAREGGITTGGLSYIFSGKRRVGIKMIRAIAKGLGLTPEIIQSHLDQSEAEGTPFSKELEHRFLLLDNDDQEEILELVESKIERYKKRRGISEKPR